MTVRLVILCGLLAGSAGAAVAGWQDKPDWGASKEFTEDYSSSQALCRKLGKPVIPLAERPTPAQRAALKGCDAEKLYYGEGVKIDYVKARLCAAIEAEGEDDNPFGGSTVLMQVYANGLGVTRNVDLATAYACHIWAAPAEYDIRISALQGLKTNPERIDYCDSITSGMAMGQCAARESRIGAVGRDAGLARLVASFPSAARAAYPAMRKTFDAFVEASAYKETDLSGTMRGVFVTDARDTLIGQFITDLKRLHDGKWPAASATDAAAADAKLNTTYRALMAWIGTRDNLTTVNADEIRETQRTWLVFRDAYVRFAAAAAPRVPRAAILARLTKLRLAQLDQIRDGGSE